MATGVRILRKDGRGVMVDGHRVTGPSLRAGRLSRVQSAKAWEDARVTGCGWGGSERVAWWPATLEEATKLLSDVECASLAFDDDDGMGMSWAAFYWLRFHPAPNDRFVGELHRTVIERSFWYEAQTYTGYLGPLHAEAAKVRSHARVVIDRAWWTSGELACALNAATRER